MGSNLGDILYLVDVNFEIKERERETRIGGISRTSCAENKNKPKKSLDREKGKKRKWLVGASRTEPSG